MIIFFAGAESKQFQRVLFQAGVENVLQSFFYCADEINDEVKFKRILIDSGGFSARTRGVSISIQSYVKFLNDNKIKYAFNLDTNSLKETLENQKILDAETDCYIIPIFHKSEWLDPSAQYLLDEWIESKPLIGVAGPFAKAKGGESRYAFLDYVFARTRNKTAVHGLGITTMDYLLRYPFYSTDSTTWLSAGKFGDSISQRSKFKAKFESKITPYNDRLLKEAKYFLAREAKITALWKSRGIEWREII